jgi:hypothetical protein
MKVYDRIKHILEAYPRARNDDRYLIFRVWYEMGLLTPEGCLSWRSFKIAPSSESLTRARRKVQENIPELQAVAKVKEKRDDKQATKGGFIFTEEA